MARIERNYKKVMVQSAWFFAGYCMAVTMVVFFCETDALMGYFFLLRMGVFSAVSFFCATLMTVAYARTAHPRGANLLAFGLGILYGVSLWFLPEGTTYWMMAAGIPFVGGLLSGAVTGVLRKINEKI